MINHKKKKLGPESTEGLQPQLENTTKIIQINTKSTNRVLAHYILPSSEQSSLQ